MVARKITETQGRTAARGKQYLLSVSGLLIFSLFFSLVIFRTSQASEQIADGEYAIEVTMTGGSGKASIESPTLLTVEDGQLYARITWSSSNYDYMIVDGEKYLNQSEEDANSSFTIPVSDLDVDITVVADTLAMGTPHEIEYVVHFYSETLGSKSSLPQEAAKRVLAMAAVIIIGGGILNYFVKKRARRDYTGRR
ncbi:MAG: hypothetical protein LUI39_05615 [Lachnospiraceae bacterium]|nr:hypothetical protein [Lachnospiraceae bacterium]